LIFFAIKNLMLLMRPKFQKRSTLQLAGRIFSQLAAGNVPLVVGVESASR
jgi:hypothetical protein